MIKSWRDRDYKINKKIKKKKVGIKEKKGKENLKEKERKKEEENKWKNYLIINKTEVGILKK